MARKKVGWPQLEIGWDRKVADPIAEERTHLEECLSVLCDLPKGQFGPYREELREWFTLRIDLLNMADRARRKGVLDFAMCAPSTTIRVLRPRDFTTTNRAMDAGMLGVLHGTGAPKALRAKLFAWLKRIAEQIPHAQSEYREMPFNRVVSWRRGMRRNLLSLFWADGGIESTDLALLTLDALCIARAIQEKRIDTSSHWTYPVARAREIDGWHARQLHGANAKEYGLQQPVFVRAVERLGVVKALMHKYSTGDALVDVLSFKRPPNVPHRLTIADRRTVRGLFRRAEAEVLKNTFGVQNPRPGQRPIRPTQSEWYIVKTLLRRNQAEIAEALTGARL